MKPELQRITKKIHPRKIPELATFLLRDEAISGKLILIATAAALIFANTPFGASYDYFWHLPLSIGLGDFVLSQDLRHWVNEGLMTFFFLMVGLEIKREFVHGELGNVKTAALPIAAAIGGMIAPALLFFAFNHDLETVHGWAIPIATDIAFAVGLLALLGKRIPSSLKLFLLTLAIVDDIGAIAVIAVFYSADINLLLLGMAGLLIIGTIVLSKLHRLSLPLFIIIGVLLWLIVKYAGVHASIAGVLLGFLAPVVLKKHDTKPLADRIEKLVIPLATLVVIPIFAFANTGVMLSLQGFTGAAVPLAGGVFFGLVVGKFIGIAGASWLMVKFKLGTLPAGTVWSQLVGVALLSGIGFTVSIFVTDLAFPGHDNFTSISKLAIFAASAVSGLLGLAVLRFLPRRRTTNFRCFNE